MCDSLHCFCLTESAKIVTSFEDEGTRGINFIMFCSNSSGCIFVILCVTSFSSTDFDRAIGVSIKLRDNATSIDIRSGSGVSSGYRVVNLIYNAPV